MPTTATIPTRSHRATGDLPVIQVSNLHKRYRDQVAVHDVSFSVERGEIFGIIGPTGAGGLSTLPPRWPPTGSGASSTSA